PLSCRRARRASCVHLIAYAHTNQPTDAFGEHTPQTIVPRLPLVLVAEERYHVLTLRRPLPSGATGWRRAAPTYSNHMLLWHAPQALAARQCTGVKRATHWVALVRQRMPLPPLEGHRPQSGACLHKKRSVAGQICHTREEDQFDPLLSGGLLATLLQIRFERGSRHVS